MLLHRLSERVVDRCPQIEAGIYLLESDTEVLEATFLPLRYEPYLKPPLPAEVFTCAPRGTLTSAAIRTCAAENTHSCEGRYSVGWSGTPPCQLELARTGQRRILLSSVENDHCQDRLR